MLRNSPLNVFFPGDVTHSRKVTTYAPPFWPPFFKPLANLYSFDPYIWAKIRRMSYFDPYLLSKYGEMYSFDPLFVLALCSVSINMRCWAILIRNLTENTHTLGPFLAQAPDFNSILRAYSLITIPFNVLFCLKDKYTCRWRYDWRRLTRVCVIGQNLQYSVAWIHLYMLQITGPAAEVITPYGKSRCLWSTPVTIHAMCEM